MAAKYTHLMRETGLSWNIDTDFPVIFDFFAFVALTKTTGICIIISVSVAKMSVVKELTFTKTRASAAQKRGSYFLISALYDGAQIIPLIIITSINPYIKKICICVLIQLNGFLDNKIEYEERNEDYF